MDLIIDSLREALRLLLQGNSYVLDVVMLSLRVSGIAILHARALPALFRVRKLTDS